MTEIHINQEAWDKMIAEREKFEDEFTRLFLDPLKELFSDFNDAEREDH